NVAAGIRLEKNDAMRAHTMACSGVLEYMAENPASQPAAETLSARKSRLMSDPRPRATTATPSARMITAVKSVAKDTGRSHQCSSSPSSARPPLPHHPPVVDRVIDVVHRGGEAR